MPVMKAAWNEVTDEQMLEWTLVGVELHFVFARAGADGEDYASWFKTRRDWCAENLLGNFALDFGSFFGFYFDRADDAFAFKMRWA